MTLATCVYAYEDDWLVRGRQYELIGHDVENRDVWVRNDTGRRRRYPAEQFDFENQPQSVLTRWRFDDPVCEPAFQMGEMYFPERNETYNFVDIVFQLSDGTARWCTLITPDYLKWLLEQRSNPAQWGGAYEPAIWGVNIIIMRDLHEKTVEWTLQHMDQRNELIAHSRLVGTDTNDYEEIEDGEKGEPAD